MISLKNLDLVYSNFGMLLAVELMLLMNREQFIQLRNVPKEINSDIRYIEKSNTTLPTLTFHRVEVENTLGVKLMLNGSYRPTLSSVVFNFSTEGSAICRLCINGRIHRQSGRNHKHELQSEDDPRLNLPFAIPREELSGRPIEEVWDWLCLHANISHNGQLIYPKGLG